MATTQLTPVRDYDFYEVDLKAGQRLTVEQWAAGFTHGGETMEL